MENKNYINYAKKGYVIIRNALSEDELQILDKEVTMLKETKHPDAEYYFEHTKDNVKLLRRVERVTIASPKIADILTKGKIINYIKELTRKTGFLFKDKYNLKLQGGKGYKPHIDGHFYWTDKDSKIRKGWLEYADSFINCVIPIDENTKENGCLQVAEKSYYDTLGGNFDSVTKQMIKGTPNVPESLMKDIPMEHLETKRGDIIFFDWRCVHGSDDNNSEVSRRVIYATYTTTSEGSSYDQYFMDKKESKGSDKQKALDS